MAQTQLRELVVGGRACDAALCDVQLTLRGPVDGAEDVEHRGLAAARLAEDDNKLAAGDGEVHAAQGGDAVEAEEVGFVYVDGPDDDVFGVRDDDPVTVTREITPTLLLLLLLAALALGLLGGDVGQLESGVEAGIVVEQS